MYKILVQIKIFLWILKQNMYIMSTSIVSETCSQYEVTVQ